jgi:hypothetical protein
MDNNEDNKKNNNEILKKFIFNETPKKFIFIDRLVTTNTIILPTDISNYIKTLLYMTKKEIYDTSISRIQSLKISLSSMSDQQAQSMAQLLTSEPAHLISQAQYQSFLTIPYNIRKTLHEKFSPCLLTLDRTKPCTTQKFTSESYFNNSESYPSPYSNRYGGDDWCP